MTINEKQDNLIADFSLFDEWLQKYQYIIDLGAGLHPLARERKIDDNLIRGCQSRLWLHCSIIDGNLCFWADSDSIIVKGLARMVIDVLSGHTPNEIADAEIYFVRDIGLQNHLSQLRSNGLISMIKKIRCYANLYR